MYLDSFDVIIKFFNLQLYTPATCTAFHLKGEGKRDNFFFVLIGVGTEVCCDSATMIKKCSTYSENMRGRRVRNQVSAFFFYFFPFIRFHPTNFNCQQFALMTSWNLICTMFQMFETWMHFQNEAENPRRLIKNSKENRIITTTRSIRERTVRRGQKMCVIRAQCSELSSTNTNVCRLVNDGNILGFWQVFFILVILLLRLKQSCSGVVFVFTWKSSMNWPHVHRNTPDHNTTRSP